MIRVGVVGSDGHARSFSAAINGLGDQPPTAWGARVTCIWSANSSEATAIASELGIDSVARSLTEVVDTTDVVMIVDDSRDGENHEELAQPFIERGTPLFIDRPISTSLASVRRILESAADRGIPVMTGSPLRYAVETRELSRAISVHGPISSVVATGPGPWWFYGYHLVAVYLGIVGPGVESVHLTLEKGSTTAMLRHRDGHDAVFQLLREGTAQDFHLAMWLAGGYEERTYVDHWRDWAECGPHTFRGRLVQRIVEMARTRVSPISPAEIMEEMEVLQAGLQSAAIGVAVDLAALR